MNRIFSLSASLLVLLLLVIRTGYAQVSLTPAGLVYTQNFDSYTGNSIASVPQWSIGGSFTYRGVGNGSSNSGGAWAYGVGTDRSLGYLGSNTSASIEYSIAFVNNTGAAITQLRISYDFEQWRYESGNTNGWTVTGTGALAAVSLSGLNNGSSNSGSNGIVQVTPKLLILNNLNLAPNAVFGIKWSCANGAGNDNGISIDNFRLEVPCTPQTVDIDTSLCAGASFILHNQAYITPQTVIDSLHTAIGCDSIRKYHLAFLPAITGVFNDSVCAGGTYNWAGQSYTTTGVYNHVFTSYKGCDSTVTLNLFVRPVITHAFPDTICTTAAYNWAGQNYTATGAYSHTFTTAAGCDSNVTLHLFVRPAISHAFADTMCSGDLYSWAGQNLNATGQYSHTFTSYTGCDSAVTLNLYVRPAITHAFADTTCAATAYNWGGQNYTATGAYNHTFTSYTGCDSTVTLNLYVRPAITHSFADTTCATNAYNWGGQNYTATGAYNHTFTSYTGCDSTVTLNLYVRPAITHAFTDTTCAATAYNWGGQSYTATGAYNHIFTSYTGCDSTVTLNLYVRPAITHAFADTTCAATTYAWGGQNYTATGTYNHTFVSYTGCDSTVTLNLYVRPAITHAFADTACAATAYAWGGQNYTATGTYNHTFVSYTGCDSTVTLNLYVRPAVSTTDSRSICYNTTYNFGGQVLNASGVYNHTFQDAHGCDSLVTLTLQVVPAITNTVNRSICYNTTLNWGAQVLTATGSYVQTFTAASSCDSIVTMNLQVMPLITDTSSHTVCFGNSYAWGAQTLNTTGTFSQVFTAANGCDSLAVIHFSVLPLQKDTLAAYICNGSAYPFGGQNYSSGGYYPVSFTAANGCDSIVVLHLTVSPAATPLVIDTAACGMVVFEGVTYNSAVTLTDTLHNTMGCDSVYRTVHIDTHPASPAVSITDTAGCETVVWQGVHYTQNTTLYDTVRSVFGCDSAVHITHIIVNHSETRTISHEMCEGETFRFNGTKYMLSGAYQLPFKNRAGCDSVIVLEITVHPLPSITLTGHDEQRNYCVGDSINLLATGAAAYTWIYTGFDTLQGEALHTVVHKYDNTIQVTGADAFGCSNEVTLSVEAHPCCNIWMPNAFSPNGDGNNDEFKPGTLGHPQNYAMRIFNRWGQNVFTTYNIDEGWKGEINGKPADIAEYYYRVSGKCVNGEIIDLKGSCTLIR